MVTRKTFKVKLTKSLIGRNSSHKACAYGLGLRKLHCIREVLDTPENRGMVNKICYMVNIEK